MSKCKGYLYLRDLRKELIETYLERWRKEKTLRAYKLLAAYERGDDISIGDYCKEEQAAIV